VLHGLPNGCKLSYPPKVRDLRLSFQVDKRPQEYEIGAWPLSMFCSAIAELSETPLFLI